MELNARPRAAYCSALSPNTKWKGYFVIRIPANSICGAEPGRRGLRCQPHAGSAVRQWALHLFLFFTSPWLESIAQPAASLVTLVLIQPGDQDRTTCGKAHTLQNNNRFKPPVGEHARRQGGSGLRLEKWSAAHSPSVRPVAGLLQSNCEKKAWLHLRGITVRVGEISNLQKVHLFQMLSAGQDMFDSDSVLHCSGWCSQKAMEA